MWEESIDMAPVIMRKEGFWGSLIKTGVKETGQVIGKEFTQSLGKEFTQSLGKEATQALGKEFTQSLGKEFTQSLGKEASQALGKEATQALGKEATQSLGKEAIQATTNSSLKKLMTIGAAGGALYGASKIRLTDTNGDGIIDENDDSLLAQGAKGAGEVLGDVAKPIAGAAADAAGEAGTSLLEGLGLDPEKIKEYWDDFIKYLKYAIYVIIAIMAVQIIVPLISAGKAITGRGYRKSKKHSN